MNYTAPSSTRLAIPTRNDQGFSLLRRVLTAPDSFTTLLLTILFDTYGSEATTWHPETIRMQLEDDFGVNIPTITMDKIVVGLTLLTSDRFFTDLPFFITLCNVFSGSEASFDQFDPADVYECGWGVTEGLLLRPPENGETFDPQITGYVTECLKNEGFTQPPRALRGLVSESLAQSDADLTLDDPGIMDGVMSSQQDKVKDVDQQNQENMTLLFEQLAQLPLASGNAKDLHKRLGQHLR